LRAHGTILEEAFGPRTGNTLRHTRWEESHRILVLCAVGLGGPATVAKRSCG
jgi:hypothetical protein